MNHSASSGLEEIGRPRGFAKGLAAALRELGENRDLIRLLVAREIKARYKNSTLGIVWSLFRPIIQLAVYYVFIGQILGAARAIPGFAIFVFTGLTLWGLFSDIVQGGTQSIVANGGLVKKIYLPREIFPLASAGSALFNFGVQLIVLLIATVVLDSPPLHLEIIYLVPALLLVLTFGLAISMTLAAINVYLRDVEHLTEVALIIGFWASPIVYSMNFVRDAIGGTIWEAVYLSNPVSLAIIAMQKALWMPGNDDPNVYWPSNLPTLLFIAILVSAFLLLISQRIFARLQGNFAQEL